MVGLINIIHDWDICWEIMAHSLSTAEWGLRQWERMLHLSLIENGPQINCMYYDLLPLEQLEQLEHLRSEDTPHRLMITHTISNFRILKQTSHATHLLKLLDKMCKYEMDPMSIVEDTEWTRFCPQTDGRTSLENLISAAMKQAAPHTCFFFLVFFIQTDRRTRWNQYTPLSTLLKGGYKNGYIQRLMDIWPWGPSQ